MSNRTDFPKQAAELAKMFGWIPETTARVEAELHNAFVAGQGARPTPDVRMNRYDMVLSINGPEMVARPDGFWTPYLTAKDALAKLMPPSSSVKRYDMFAGDGGVYTEVDPEGAWVEYEDFSSALTRLSQISRDEDQNLLTLCWVSEDPARWQVLNKAWDKKLRDDPNDSRSMNAYMNDAMVAGVFRMAQGLPAIPPDEKINKAINALSLLVEHPDHLPSGEVWAHEVKQVVQMLQGETQP